MKRASFALLAALAVIAPSCDGSEDPTAAVEAAAGKLTEGLDGLKDFDISSLAGADAMNEKAGEISGMLGEQLGKITDLASAEKAKDAVAPALDVLGKLKDGLGGKLPDMSSLTGVIDKLKSSFGEKADIMAVLNPIIDQIKGLIGG